MHGSDLMTIVPLILPPRDRDLIRAALLSLDPPLCEARSSAGRYEFNCA